MPTNHEKYLAGEPLNEELRALREGRLQATEPWMQQAVAGALAATGQTPAGDPRRALSQAERVALRELRLSPGWPVLQKLLERATMLHTEHATSLSQDDPLGKSDEIAQLWAYVKVQKRVHREINGLVEMELAGPPETGASDGRTKDDTALQGA